MKPLITKLLIMAVAATMWPSLASADDQNGWSSSTDRHSSNQQYDRGHDRGGSGYRNDDRHRGYDNGHAYTDGGAAYDHQGYSDWDRRSASRRFDGYYPAYPRYLSTYPRHRSGGSVDIFLGGRGGYGHHGGHYSRH